MNLYSLGWAYASTRLRHCQLKYSSKWSYLFFLSTFRYERILIRFVKQQNKAYCLLRTIKAERLTDDKSCNSRFHCRSSCKVTSTCHRQQSGFRAVVKSAVKLPDGIQSYVGVSDVEFLQNILDLYFKYFKLSEDVVNRILQVILDLQHFKSSLLILAATILQISSAIHHLSNIDNMYIKSYSFSLFSSLPVSHSLWSSQSFGHQKAINGFDMPLPVAVCSGLVNPLAPRKGKFHGGLITMSTLCT
ncbi:hypothetical protein Tco_1006433 [Tanacetum coccineum]|uniref:Maturase n=1 Tax=Tanacetum coccineum TaxID=301880 RepID=A0ABQ5FHR0_9ASTR